MVNQPKRTRLEVSRPPRFGDLQKDLRNDLRKNTENEVFGLFSTEF
jgi:hypothetical protein